MWHPLAALPSAHVAALCGTPAPQAFRGLAGDGRGGSISGAPPSATFEPTASAGIPPAFFRADQRKGGRLNANGTAAGMALVNAPYRETLPERPRAAAGRRAGKRCRGDKRLRRELGGELEFKC